MIEKNLAILMIKYRMAIKAVGFDWGGVISGEPGPSSFNITVAKILEVPVKVYTDAHFKYNRLVNIESYTNEQYWPIILKELGKQEKYDEIMGFLKNRKHSQINKSIVKLIIKLKKSGHKLGLLSNTTLQGAEKIRESEVAKHFDVIVTSAEIGHMKPDKKAFQTLIDKLGVEPTELIFIDDTERVLSTSAEVGYKPIVFSNYERLINDLKAEKIL